MQQQTEELEELRAMLAKEKQKAKQIWRQKCEQQLSHEEAIDEKDMEIAVRLKARLLLSSNPIAECIYVCPWGTSLEKESRYPAPCRYPIDAGKPRPSIHSVLRAQTNSGTTVCSLLKEQQNGMFAWIGLESLLQLAGHLTGKARQEFSLLFSDDKDTFSSATVAMRKRLAAGSRVLVAQDFRHATQGPQEMVSDYILRLEIRVESGSHLLTHLTQ